MPDKIDQAKIISRNIKELRENLGWNQSKLASEAGITAAALSKIEKDDGRVPTIVVLNKIASALKVQPYEITGEEPPNLSEASERNREFYRKWDILESLSPEDQKLLKGMAERLKTITEE
ncbi:MAG TPA: helix-turn-helix transcriptional regulator [Desulfobacteraceae bacterium]|nr:helix-turn-helix transcriptional regulator [Desulfobacteraceae bacterium]HPJ67094.1 helix-turn-helix transcriptional regulator [Desulfobacteraceae bacterium]HPQ29220.1 helix-turn-helix transcriptional regulator [Desulfobacteraceae bacterium]